MEGKDKETVFSTHAPSSSKIHLNYSSKSDLKRETPQKMITAEEEQMLRQISAEPVKAFLQTAILSKTKGDSYNYNHIVHQLRIRDDQDMVATVYVGLSSCVSQFTPR